MCDNTGRKRKRSFESSRTVKGVFKKGDLDDSLSTSDWGLIIDENYVSLSLLLYFVLIFSIIEIEKKRSLCQIV